MSGSASRTIAIRLTTEQADRVKRDLQAIGDEGSKALGRIETASAAASPALQTLASVSDGAVQAFGRMGVSLGGLERVLTSSRGGLSGVTLGISALAAVGATAGVSIARAGDALTSTLARLTAATGSMQTAQGVYRELFALSQQTGVSVAESADAFGRFAVAARSIGATNTQVLALVRTLQQAGIVSGASTAETQAAVAQLGQALASGVLQGDELRSLLENMPQLASRLAEQLGVSVGQLRQMGAAGELTADRVMPALIKAGETINAQFAAMPPTMGRAFSVLGESMANFAGNLDHALGLSQAIAKAALAAAGAVNAVRVAAMPTDAEAADQAVASAKTTLGNLYQRRQAAQGQIAAYLAQGLTQQQATDLALPTAPGSTDKPLSDQIVAAQQQLADAIRAREQLLQDARDREGRAQSEALARQIETEKAALEKQLQTLKEGNDKKIAINREYQQTTDKLNDAAVHGLISQTELSQGLANATKKRDDALKALVKTTDDSAKQRQKVIDGLAAQLAAAQAATAGTKAGSEAAHQMALALEIEQKQRAAGIPVVEKRTEADKKAAAAIADYVTKLDALKTANSAAEKSATATAAQQKKLDAQATRTTDSIVNYAGDKFADLFSSTGKGWAGLMDSLKQTAIATFARIAAEALLRPIVMPIVASLVGSTGSLGGMAGVVGGRSGILGNISSLLGLSNLGSQLGLPSLGSALGLTGAGGALTGLLSTAIIPGATASTTAALAGMSGFGPATLAQFNAAGGAGILGGSGATLGGLLGGAGLGFGAGTLLNGMLGGNQVNGTIGSGVGAAAGAAIGSIIPGVGTIIGGLIGGALGGAGGGLIGPRKTDATAVGTYDLATGAITQSNGPKETQQTQSGRQTALTAMQQAYQALAALVGSSANVQAKIEVGQRDGNKLYLTQDGVQSKQTTGIGDIAGLVTLFKNDLVGAFHDAAGDVKKVLDAAGGNYDTAVAGLSFLQGTYKSLTDTTPALTAYAAALKAINDNYTAAEQQATQYGLSVQAVADAHNAAIVKLDAGRDAQAQSITDALRIRLMNDSGDARGAALLSFDLQATAQQKALKDQIDALGLTGTQYAAERIIDIEKALAQERLAIEKQYAAQSKQVSQGLLSQLAFGASSALSPEQQYFAALSVLNTARHDLDAGGALSDYASAAQQVLPVARDYLGTSQRYAALVADIAGTVSSAGGDPAGLGALLANQVDSTDNLSALYATIANKQLDTANATLAELKRLASTLEALIARQTAA